MLVDEIKVVLKWPLLEGGGGGSFISNQMDGKIEDFIYIRSGSSTQYHTKYGKQLCHEIARNIARNEVVRQVG